MISLRILYSSNMSAAPREDESKWVSAREWRIPSVQNGEKDSQTASSLIFFVIDTASRFAFGLQQERMGSHVHRASWCRNLIKKKSSKWTPFLPHCSSFSPSSFCFLCVSLLPSPHALYPHFKIEAYTVDITICGKPVFTGCHIDDFRKRKKIAHFTFQVGLNLTGTKAQYFSRKEKNPNPNKTLLEVAMFYNASLGYDAKKPCAPLWGSQESPTQEMGAGVSPPYLQVSFPWPQQQRLALSGCWIWISQPMEAEVGPVIFQESLDKRPSTGQAWQLARRVSMAWSCLWEVWEQKRNALH